MEPEKTNFEVSAGTWPSGVGDAASLIRSRDWSDTPLGPAAAWPQSLKTIVSMALACEYPMIVLWGPDLIQLYNDSYSVIMGARHPVGMGQPNRECWSEVWHINESLFARVYQGETLTFTDQLYPVMTSGYLEDLFVDICYSPLRDETDCVGGILVTVFDTTKQVAARMRAERQAAFLNQIHVATMSLANPDKIVQTVARLTADHLGVDRVVYCIFDTDEDTFRITSESVGPEVAEMAGWFKLSDFGAAAEEFFHLGRVTAVDDVQSDRRTAEVWAAYAAQGIQAHVAMPLLKGGRLVAAMGVHQLTPRAWREDEVSLLEVVASRCWESIERVRAQMELHRQWLSFDTSLSHTPDLIHTFDLSGRIVYANRPLLQLWGRSLEDSVGLTFLELGYPTELAAKLQEQIGQVIATGASLSDETPFVGADGRLREYEYCLVPVFGPMGDVVEVAGSTWDITERYRNEEQMRTSLAERETLLKEIHHRVKNNLQVIVSLLSLQADQISDPAALIAFRDTQSRVRAIARIHETLYSSRDLAQVEFGHYARVLVGDLVAFYDVDPTRIKISVATEDMVLDIDQAIPLGLILNELVTNCLKHGFPGNAHGTIDVSLAYVHESIEPGQTLDVANGVLRVSDTGIGLVSDFDLAAADSMGMYLVRILTRQLHGRLELEEGPGTGFYLTFPLSQTSSEETL